MESTEMMKIVQKPRRAKKPDAGQAVLEIDYGSVKDFLSQAVLRYDEDRNAYFDRYADDPQLVRITQQWERSTRKLVGWAETWYFVQFKDPEEQKNALAILEQVSKDSAVRLRNLRKQQSIVKAMEESETRTGRLADLEKADDRADLFLRSCLKTEQHFNDKFVKGDTCVSFEVEGDREAAIQLEKTMPLIPRGKLFRRGIIFPMERIPVGVRVPKYPDAFERVQYLEPEGLVYDTELDELVVKPGYVTEDGLIDDHSVVWHPENMTVDIGYVGGVRTTWSYWKARDERDVPDPDSWMVEYLQRGWDQFQQDHSFGLLQHRANEDDYPYDRIPPH